MTCKIIFRRFHCLFIFISVAITTHAQEPFKLGQDYVIESFTTSRVLDVYNFSKDNGASIIFWDRHDQNNQIFHCEPAGDGFYLLRNILSNKFIEIRNSEQGDDAVAQQWEYTGAHNQQFKMVPASNTGFYFIIARHSNKVLQHKSGSEKGAVLSQTTNTGVITQMFRFVPVNVTTTPPPPPSPKELPLPVLLSPADGFQADIFNGEVINFDWEDVPQATEYRLFVRYQNDKDVLLDVDVTNSAFTFRMTKSLPYSMQTGYWKWWVRAKYGNVIGPWSKPSIINQNLNQPVRYPVSAITYPQANAVLDNGSSDGKKEYHWDFAWSTIVGASAYEIYIGIPNKYDIYKTITGTNTYTHRQENNADFNDNYRYGWICKVRPLINGVWGVWGPTQPFSLAPALVPAVPVKPKPATVFQYDGYTCWAKCGYLQTYLATKQQVYSGKDLTWGPLKLVVEQKSEQRAILKFISVKGTDEKYLIEVLYRETNGQLKSMGYLLHSLEISSLDDNTWKIATYADNFVRIYLPEANLALQIVDGTNYDPTITIQLKPMSEHQRQLFKFIPQ